MAAKAVPALRDFVKSGRSSSPAKGTKRTAVATVVEGISVLQKQQKPHHQQKKVLQQQLVTLQRKGRGIAPPNKAPTPIYCVYLLNLLVPR